jgi:hyperosmotically inducible protein
MFASEQTQMMISPILCISSFTYPIGTPLRNNTHFKSTLLAIALAASTASTLAFAVDNPTEANQNAYATSFKALDTDNSETLTESEVQKEKLFDKNFVAADENNNGSLSEEEYSNYKSQVEQKNVKRVASDSLITSKVKANLLKEEGLKSLKVSVKTHQSVVLLSGFVETEAQIYHAAKIAAETEGVTSVKNSLVLKKD